MSACSAVHMNVIRLLITGAFLASGQSAYSAPSNAGARRMATYANPIDLPYRYQPRSRAPYYREAADPTIVRFKGRYWLFASHSKGYWWSTDLLKWTFIKGRGYDVNRFAPTAIVKGGKLYLTASEKAKKIWVTDDPMTGEWAVAADISPGYEDPALFHDDDGQVYLYHGLSGTDTLQVIRLDPKTFEPLGKSEIPQSRNKQLRGWEVVGDRNELEDKPSFIEGAWMTKYKGRYYLEYSAPGTEYKTYANGLLLADDPMGPFAYQSYSPFALKSTGFATGAGHGSTFVAADGNWWHAGTMTISIRHIFERRLGLFPSYFTRDGQLVTDTYLGDYPRFADGRRELTGWMLLSRKKQVVVSSSLDGFAAENAVDEDIRTWWSAKTGGPDEWFQIDLGSSKRVEAIQVNFADQDSDNNRGISEDGYKYMLEVSLDGRSWRIAVDRSGEGRDSPHDYQVLREPMRARYVRVRNVHAPDNGKFSLYDLRVFGNSSVPPPGRVRSGTGRRDAADRRKAAVSWRPAARAEFYIVRVGPRPDLLIQNYQVYDGATSLALTSLNADTKYHFAVDAVNERGITKGTTLGQIE